MVFNYLIPNVWLRLLFNLYCLLTNFTKCISFRYIYLYFGSKFEFVLEFLIPALIPGIVSLLFPHFDLIVSKQVLVLESLLNGFRFQLLQLYLVLQSLLQLHKIILRQLHELLFEVFVYLQIPFVENQILPVGIFHWRAIPQEMLQLSQRKVVCRYFILLLDYTAFVPVMHL